MIIIITTTSSSSNTRTRNKMRPLAAVAAVTVIIITMVVVPGRDKPLPHASAGLGKPALQPQPRFLASFGMTPARGYGDSARRP